MEMGQSPPHGKLNWGSGQTESVRFGGEENKNGHTENSEFLFLQFNNVQGNAPTEERTPVITKPTTRNITDNAADSVGKKMNRARAYGRPPLLQ